MDTPADGHPGAGRAVPVVAGHRGNAGQAPENTALSFAQAVAAGADMIETDVQLSADGVPFLFHDGTGLRTTNVDEVFGHRAGDPITSFTAAELRQLDAGSYFGGQFAGARIPLLSELPGMVDFAADINLELKSPRDSPGVEQAVAQALAGQEDWVRLRRGRAVLVSSFDQAALRRFSAAAPEIPVWQLGPLPDDDGALAAGAEWLHGMVTDHRLLTAAAAARVRAAGLGLGVYTVNNHRRMAELLELGPDVVISDFPGVLAAVLRGEDPLPGATGLRVRAVVPDGGAGAPEHLVLVNSGTETVDPRGYRLQVQDSAGGPFTVGGAPVLAPGEQLRLFTAAGSTLLAAHPGPAPGQYLRRSGGNIALLTPELRPVDLFQF